MKRYTHPFIHPDYDCGAERIAGQNGLQTFMFFYLLFSISQNSLNDFVKNGGRERESNEMA